MGRTDAAPYLERWVYHPAGNIILFASVRHPTITPGCRTPPKHKAALPGARSPEIHQSIFYQIAPIVSRADHTHTTPATPLQKSM